MLWRGARLDASLYEQVEHDPGHLGPAGAAVGLVALATGAGAGFFSLDRGGEAALTAFLLRFAGTWVGWFLWAAISLWVGTYLTAGRETRSSLGELLRVLAFAHVPWMLNLFLFVPLVGPALFFLSSLWVLAAGVVAIRQALDFTTTRAVATVAIGWVVMIAMTLVLILISLALGPRIGSLIP